MPRVPGRIKAEFGVFLAAVQYFTRLPVPAWVEHSQTRLDGAARYFPAVGVLVGAVGALTLLAAREVWPTPVAVALSMLVGVVLTGAFHEDGLADTVDGLGGSFERARALEIMKDSRIGSFGALAVALALLIKFAVLSSLNPIRAACLLIAGHSASRCAGVALMRVLPYVRDADASRSKPLVQSVSSGSLGVAVITAAVIMIPVGRAALLGAAAVAIATLWWRRVLVRRLNGYTGDCLGALQQITEIAFYLGCTVAL